MDSLRPRACAVHACLLALAIAIGSAIQLSSADAAERLPVRQCGAFPNYGAFGIKAKGVGCKRAGRVARRWRKTMPQRNGSGRVLGFYCRYRDLRMARARVRCTGPRGRFVRWRTRSIYGEVPSEGSGASVARNGLIAFDRSSYTTRGKTCCIRIFTMSPDGTGVRPLIPNRTPGINGRYLRSRIFEPVFTPSGRRIAFLGRFGIFTMNLDGSDLRQVLDDNGQYVVGSFAYSPDGGRFVAVNFTGQSLFTMGADGSSPLLLPNTSAYLDPSFTPDGSRIIVTRSRGSRFSLVTMRLDGSAVRPIPHTGMGAQGSYSPDGRWIVFTRLLSGSTGLARYGLFKVRANGAKAIRLGRITSVLSLMSPSFSPDGRFIVFSARRSARGYDSVYTIRANGRRLRRLTRAGFRVSSSHPTWQPLHRSR